LLCRQKPQEGPEKSHWRRQQSSVFFHKDDIPEAAQISEGYLYKRGRIVKSWKLRWFVLDTEKGEVGVEGVAVWCDGERWVQRAWQSHWPNCCMSNSSTISVESQYNNFRIEECSVY